jgi:hypothetical protein
LNPGSPAWGAGVLVQARRPPLCVYFYLFLGFKSIICFSEESYFIFLGLLASSSWLFMCSSMALFNGINSPGFLLGGWCALIVFSPCHCSAPWPVPSTITTETPMMQVYVVLSPFHSARALHRGFRVPLIRSILHYFLVQLSRGMVLYHSVSLRIASNSYNH